MTHYNTLFAELLDRYDEAIREIGICRARYGYARGYALELAPLQERANRLRHGILEAWALGSAVTTFNAGWDAAVAYARQEPYEANHAVAKHDAWSELSSSSSVTDKGDV